MAHPSPPQNESPADASMKPDAAVDLLNDLEERLGALRNWQSQSEAQAQHVRQQTDDLEQRRKSLEDLQAKLDQERDSIAAQSSDLDTQRQDIQTQREQIESQRQELEQQQQQIEQRRDQLQAHATDVENQLDAKHRELEETERQRLEAITQKERATAESQSALDEARQRAEAREHRLDEAYAKLRDDESALGNMEQELRTKLEELEATAAQLDQRKTTLNDAEAKLNADREQLDQRTEEIDGRLAELDEQRQQTEQRHEELTRREAELKTAQAEYETQKNALEAERAKLTQDRKDLHRVQLDQQLRSEALQAQEQALSKARAELVEQASDGAFTAEDQTRQDAKLAEAVALAEQHRQDALRSAAELEELQGRIEERERELRDLQTAFETASNQPAQAPTGVADTEQDTQDADEYVARFDDDEDDAASNEQLEQLQSLIAQRESEIVELQRELDDARRELGDRVAEVELLTERIEELTEQAKNANTATAPVSDDEDALRHRAELDEQAAQIAADRQRILERKAQLKQADAIIQKRRDKIRQYIGQLKNAKTAPDPTSAPVAQQGLSLSDQARIAGVEKEREALKEVKHLLEQSEAVMVRRWATQRTSGVVTSIIIALALAAGIAFYVGDRFAIPLFRATLSMQIVPDADAEELPNGAWLAAYKSQILTTPVLGEVLNELDQKGVRVASDPEALADHFRETLAVTGTPAQLNFAYHGEDREQISTVLDAVGEGLLTFHMIQDRRAGRISDSATVTKPALSDAKPVVDDRNKYALATFAGIVGLAALLAMPMRFFFGRSKRVLHPSNMPELAMLQRGPEDWAKQAQEEEKAIGVSNDGPPTGFARLPDKPEDSDANDDSSADEVFRF